jgi:hypothetical protein
VRSTRSCIWPRPPTRWLQTREPVTCMISISLSSH